MKAALLERFGSPLHVTDIPEPELGSGEIIVDVAAAPVLAYARDILSGARNYSLQLPAVPGGGAIGRVRALGPDATTLRVGDWVFCDPTVRSRDNHRSPDIVLQGITAASPRAQRLQSYFRHGAWAERLRIPTENATALGSVPLDAAARWSALGRLLVPYGGMLAAQLQAGETLVLNGATGAFGSAGVLVAVALGVRAVVATGRNESVLAELAQRLGPRVVPVVMSGDESRDRERIEAAAPAPIDCVLDLLPPAATAAQTRAAVLTVRPGGRVVLMGGVGMSKDDPLALPYPWIMRNNVTLRGQWMYPPWAAAHMVALVRAGLIDLDQFAVTKFSLDRANDAVEHAATHTGLFELTALTP